MKISVVGARKYQDRQSVLDLVRSLPADATIITSSCRGVCTWAKQAAEERGMKVIVFALGFTVGGGIVTLDGIVVQQALIETVMTRTSEGRKRLGTINHYPLAPWKED